MKKTTLTLLLASALLLTACEEKQATIDVSSAKTFTESTQKVRSALTEDQKKLFDDAINDFNPLALSEYEKLDSLPDSMPQKAILKAKFIENMNEINGLTGEEMIAKGKEKKIAELIQERESILQRMPGKRSLEEPLFKEIMQKTKDDLDASLQKIDAELKELQSN